MNLPPNAAATRTVSIAWSTQRAEWQVRLFQAATDGPFQIRGSGWSIADGFYRLSVVTPDGQPTGVELCYAPLDGDQVLTFLLSDAPVPPEIQAEIGDWIDVALRGIGGEPTQFGWYATIGTRHGPWFGHPFKFGNVLLTPANQRLGRWEMPERFPSLGTLQTGSFSVLLISGTAPGHDWQQASRLAAGEVALAAGLLTVVTGQSFDVLGASNRLEADAPPPPIDQLITGMNDRLEPEFGVSLACEGEPFALPGWIDSAWEWLHEKPWLASAVLVFLEGCRITESHPSLAGVAFVAAIEAVGGRMFEMEWCSCGQHRDTTARFRETVTLVNRPEDVAALTADYKIRSKLVHQGILPGWEPVHGSFGAFDPYSQDAIDQYERGTLFRVRGTARTLLAFALQDQLPVQTKLAPDPS